MRTKTGGRKKGVPNKATTAKFEALKKGGKLPLDYMLAVMRDPKQPDARRDAMAISAAQYCHPRLAAVEAHHSGNVTMTHEQALDELDN